MPHARFHDQISYTTDTLPTHTRTHTHTHTHTHTNTHAHAHAHTHARTHTSYTRDDAQLDTLVFGDGANHLELVMPAAPPVEVDVSVPQREQQ